VWSFETPPVRVASPLDVKELAIEVPAVTMPAPGLYHWQVICTGEVIHERKLPAGLVGGWVEAEKLIAEFAQFAELRA
jgi:hypothetical protein